MHDSQNKKWGRATRTVQRWGRQYILLNSDSIQGTSKRPQNRGPIVLGDGSRNTSLAHLMWGQRLIHYNESPLPTELPDSAAQKCEGQFRYETLA